MLLYTRRCRSISRARGTADSRGVVVNSDLAERFPRPRSQQRGSLRPRARRVAVLAVGGGGDRHSRNFFEIFDAKSRVWGQFGPENKLIEGQPNEYDLICRNASVASFHLTSDICRSAVPTLKYLPERRSTAFRTTTALSRTRKQYVLEAGEACF